MNTKKHIWKVGDCCKVEVSDELYTGRIVKLHVRRNIAILSGLNLNGEEFYYARLSDLRTKD